MKSRRMIVRAGSDTYPVIVGQGLASELATAIRSQGERRVALVTDSTVRRLWGAHLLREMKRSGHHVELISFPHGERNKNQDTVTALHHELLKRKFGRDSVIVAVGGGVVGDVAGYVAATYLRGIPYIQVPTTLLAMVDSSIGGKVGIDTPYGKNTVGAFWHPKAVIADIQYLEKLPKRELVSGLLEAVKTFITSDKKALLLANKLDLGAPLKTAQALQDIVFASVSIKAGVVERDQYEKNERRIINFGHTIGHAVEMLSGFRIPHGFAVGYGMLGEAKVSHLLGILPEAEFEALRAYLKPFGVTEKALSDFPVKKILEATRADKKTRGGKPYYVLLERMGSVSTNGGQFAHAVEDSVVIKALQALRD